MPQVAGGWAGLAGGVGLRGGCWGWADLAGAQGGAACWGFGLRGGGWLGLGWLRLAGVAALAGGVAAGDGCFGWGVWLLRMAGVAGSAGFGSGTGRVFGWLGWRGWLARLARRLAGFGSGICLSSLACLLRLGAWPALVWGVWLGCCRRDLSRCWFRLAA